MSKITTLRWQAPPLIEPPPPQFTPPDADTIQAIIDSAREEGFSAGYRDGLAGGQADIRRSIAQIEGILDGFTRPLARLDGEVSEALATLAVRIAGALVNRQYQAEPELLATLANQALDIAAQENRSIELRLHPDDLNAIATHLQTPDRARLTADPQLARGDLRIHGENLRIDGSLDARLRAVLEQLLLEGTA